MFFLPTELPCKCQDWSTCAWSKQVVDQIILLNNRTDHEQKRQQLSEQFVGNNKDNNNNSFLVLN